MTSTRELMRQGQQIPEEDRDAHERFALAHGFFWEPCVLCGRMSGGHEWRDIDGKPSEVHLNPDEPTTGTGICPQCTRDGKGERLPGIVCFCAECAAWRASLDDLQQRQGLRGIIEPVSERAPAVLRAPPGPPTG